MADFQIANNPIGERLVNSFFPTKYHNNGLINQEETEKLYFYDFARNFAAFRQVSIKNPDKNISNSRDHKVARLQGCQASR